MDNIFKKYPIFLLVLSFFACDKENNNSANFVLWQLPSQIPTQNMSYVMITQEGNIIVIDGGNKEDSTYLMEFIKPYGDNISAWFITHPHPDHVGALISILEQNYPIKIENIYASLPSEEWVAKYEPYPPSHLKTLKSLNDIIKNSNLIIKNPNIGSIIEIDQIRFKILGIKNDSITINAVNNSSMVFSVDDANKSVLFLGDLGVEGGIKLFSSSLLNELNVDYVQMSHHGQGGVNYDFYKAVSPSACLWPTPLYLWDNDDGKGPGTGPYDTHTVRGWMDELSVKKHYVSAFGLQNIGNKD